MNILFVFSAHPYYKYTEWILIFYIGPVIKQVPEDEKGRHIIPDRLRRGLHGALNKLRNLKSPHRMV